MGMRLRLRHGRRNLFGPAETPLRLHPHPNLHCDLWLRYSIDRSQ